MGISSHRFLKYSYYSKKGKKEGKEKRFQFAISYFFSIGRAAARKDPAQQSPRCGVPLHATEREAGVAMAPRNNFVGV